MHEHGVVSTAVANLLQLGGDIDTVVVRVGPRAEPDVVTASWEHVVTGTPLERARVTWERGTDGLQCFACATEYVGEPLDPCPACGEDGLVVTRAPDVVAIPTFAGETD